MGHLTSQDWSSPGKGFAGSCSHDLQRKGEGQPTNRWRWVQNSFLCVCVFSWRYSAVRSFLAFSVYRQKAQHYVLPTRYPENALASWLAKWSTVSRLVGRSKYYLKPPSRLFARTNLAHCTKTLNSFLESLTSVAMLHVWQSQHKLKTRKEAYTQFRRSRALQSQKQACIATPQRERTRQTLTVRVPSAAFATPPETGASTRWRSRSSAGNYGTTRWREGG